MRTAPKILAVLIAGCLPLLVACSNEPKQQPTAKVPERATKEPKSALGNIVKNATDKARSKIATSNISISDGLNINVNGREIGRRNGLPKAEITPQGDLLLKGRPVAVTAAQRALLLQYRQHLIAVIGAGMDIGVQGADLGMRAAGEAFKGIFSGNADEAGHRIEAEAKKIEASADRLCDLLPPLLATQEQIAATLPEFRPYATTDRGEIDDCHSQTTKKRTPPKPPQPPAPPAPPPAPTV